MVGRCLAKPQCIGSRPFSGFCSGIECFLTGLVGRNSAKHQPRVGLRTTGAVIAWPVLGQSRQLSTTPPASPEGHKQPPRRLGPAGGDQIVGGGDDGQQLVDSRLGVPQTPASTISLYAVSWFSIFSRPLRVTSLMPETLQTSLWVLGEELSWDAL